MRCAVFTVDVDRDVNLPEKGRYGAISKPCINGDCAPRFSSARMGLELLVDLMDELGIEGTFFLEGDTLRAIVKNVDVRGLLKRHEVASHGICHEDLTGEDTGICMTDLDMALLLEDSVAVVRDICGRRPMGFRAPYLHIDQRGLRMLAKMGFLYDSSRVKNIEKGTIRPWKIEGRLLEMPIASGIDQAGNRIASYFWPMHEGKRRARDYCELASSVKEGALVYATHSWHVVETYEKGRMGKADIVKNLADVRKVLEGVMDSGMGFVTLEHLARDMEGMECTK